MKALSNHFIVMKKVYSIKSFKKLGFILKEKNSKCSYFLKFLHFIFFLFEKAIFEI